MKPSVPTRAIRVVTTTSAARRSLRLRADQGGPRSQASRGVRLGLPKSLPPEIVQRIQHERAEGKTLATIADALNEESVPTAHGGRTWHRATIRQVLLTNADTPAHD